VNKKLTTFLRRLRFFFVLALLLAGALAVVGLVALRRFENRILYNPSPDITQTPHDLQLDFQPVEFRTSDNLTLSGWWISAPRPLATVVWFHGNSGNVSHLVRLAPWFWKKRLNLFLWDYRGYGHNPGKPSESGLRRDSLAALEVARQMNRKHNPPLPLILYGHGLGASLALQTAQAHPDWVSAIVLEGAFPSIDALKDAYYPPPRLLHAFPVSQHYDASAPIAALPGIPKLIAHSPDDETIPFALGVSLARTASPPSTFATLSGGHSDHSWFDPSTPSSASLDSFLSALLTPP
jgi:hypothetical protein